METEGGTDTEGEGQLQTQVTTDACMTTDGLSEAGEAEDVSWSFVLPFPSPFRPKEAKTLTYHDPCREIEVSAEAAAERIASPPPPPCSPRDLGFTEG